MKFLIFCGTFFDSICTLQGEKRNFTVVFGPKLRFFVLKIEKPYV